LLYLLQTGEVLHVGQDGHALRSFLTLHYTLDTNSKGFALQTDAQ